LQRVREACDRTGVVLAYLPPYSPDLNPIEEAFAQLKGWYKGNYRLCPELDFADFLDLGLRSLYNNGAGHFYRCQIGRPIADGNESDYDRD
jgi:transposase